MPDVHYCHPRLAAIYDVSRPWSSDFDFYLSLARSEPTRILDLGCGTGLLSRAYAAKNHQVTGVDPSSAMLEVGRREPHGAEVEWVQSFAQNFRSEKRFDLIIMTGHAFQVLLTDTDMLVTLAMMRTHLAPGGLAVFESRNPAFDWAEVWDDDKAFAVPDVEFHKSTRLLSLENDRLTFEQEYRFPDVSLVSKSVLRFPSKAHIEACLSASGLQTDDVLGDWRGQPFDASASREMIFVVRSTDREPSKTVDTM